MKTRKDFILKIGDTISIKNFKGTVIKQYRKLIYREDRKSKHENCKYYLLKCGCGNLIEIRENNFINQGVSCPKCGDGISFPNKIMFNILDQLKVDFIREYNPKWANGKKYDFYLPKYKLIIEMDGNQHSGKGFSSCGGRSKKEENINDSLKDQMAKSNGIKLIRINCSKSDLVFIKDNISKSELINYLSLNKINYTKVVSFSYKSLIHHTCELYSNGYAITEISDMLKIHKQTVQRYLRIASQEKMCNYFSQKKEVICINTKDIFSSLTDAAKWSGLSDCTHIIDVCKGKRNVAGVNQNTKEKLKWRYYEDYLKLHNETQELEDAVNI